MYTHTDTHIPHSHAPKRHYKAINSVFYEGAIILHFRALKYSIIALCIDLTVFYIDKKEAYILDKQKIQLNKHLLNTNYI